MRRIGDSPHLGEIVRNHDDGAVFLEIDQQILDHRARLFVERGGRFVEQQRLRFEDKRPGDAEPLLLACEQGPPEPPSLFLSFGRG